MGIIKNSFPKHSVARMTSRETENKRVYSMSNYSTCAWYILIAVFLEDWGNSCGTHDFRNGLEHTCLFQPLARSWSCFYSRSTRSRTLKRSETGISFTRSLTGLEKWACAQPNPDWRIFLPLTTRLELSPLDSQSCYSHVSQGLLVSRQCTANRLMC